MDNFTPRAQQVLQLARKQADTFNHGYVGTEHILLGLIALGHGVAINALQSVGVDFDSVRLEIEKAAGTGPETKTIGSIPFTPRAKKVLALSANEARNLGHSYVGTEHILLGLLNCLSAYQILNILMASRSPFLTLSQISSPFSP